MSEQIAIVAGGSAGVGRAVVSKLIENGYRVGVLARGKARLREMEATYGDHVVCLSCDVADARRVAKAGAAIEEALGPVSVWVNCAMMTSFSPFQKMEPDEFQRIVDTTLIGVVNGTRTALSLMQTHVGGRIINVGSGLAYRAVPYQSAYCASKHAINGFTSSVRSELIRAGANVSLSLVQLPALNTPQFDWARNRLTQKPQPAPPIYQPEVAANAVWRATKEGGREYFVGKSVLQLIFGTMVLPGWLDKKMADSGAEMQKSGEDEPGDRPDNLSAPVDSIKATAHGRFADRAQGNGWIVDADRARIAVFGGALLVAFGLGLILG